MNAKYVELYNSFTDSKNDFIVIEETPEDYITLLPLTYYWLERVNRLDLANEFVTKSNKMIFSLMNRFENDELRETIQKEGYITYIDDFLLDESDYEYINEFALFLEHYMYHCSEENTVKRIEKSLLSHKMDEKKFLSRYARFVGHVLSKSSSFSVKEKRELSETKKYDWLLPYITMK